MTFGYFWPIMAMVSINIALLIVLLIKFKKQERFQTDEAHTNLDLINRALSRLSDIAESLEQHQESPSGIDDVLAKNEQPGRDRQSKGVGEPG
jgi:hypothetical protein